MYIFEHFGMSCHCPGGELGHWYITHFGHFTLLSILVVSFLYIILFLFIYFDISRHFHFQCSPTSSSFWKLTHEWGKKSCKIQGSTAQQEMDRKPRLLELQEINWLPFFKDYEVFFSLLLAHLMCMCIWLWVSERRSELPELIKHNTFL